MYDSSVVIIIIIIITENRIVLQTIKSTIYDGYPTIFGF